MKHLKNQLFIYILYMCAFNSLMAQVIIEGTIVDTQSKHPIPYATVILKDAENSFLKGVTTNEEGFYKLSHEKGNYILQIDFLGYQTLTNSIELVDNLTQDYKLIAKTEELDEVMLIAERTSVEQLIDKKIINVGKDILASGGSASTVLSQLSEINADENGSIALRGNENIQVLINGKPSPLSNAELLNQMDANEIKTIEIITSPSAKYRSDGLTGIINIITQKKVLKGFKISNSIALSSLGSFNGSITLRYGKKKIGYKFGVSYRKNKSNSTYKREGVGSFPYKEESKSNYLGDVYRINAGMDWFPNKRNEFSWGVQYNNNTHGSDVEGNIIVANTTTQQDLLNKHIHRTFKTNTNYRYQFLKETDYLEVDAQLTNNKNTLTGLFFPNINAIDNITENEIQTTDLAIDYVNQMSDKVKLETGYLWHTRTLDNERERIANATTLENYTYQYNTHALYVLSSIKLNHLEIQTGLRAELFNSKADFVAENIQIRNAFTNLFPSLHFKYSENKVHTFGLGFNRRTSRPRIRQINPISQQSNEFSFSEGNPNLQSEFSNNIDVSYQYKQKKLSISPTLSYQNKENSIFRNQYLNNEGIQIYSYDNYKGSDVYGLELAMTYKVIKWWGCKFNYNWNYENLKVATIDLSSDFARSHQFTFKNDFRINKKLKTNLSWRYNASNVGFYQDNGELQFVDFGCRYSMFDKKRHLSLRVTDIFNTKKYNRTAFGDDYIRYSNSKPSSRAIHLAFSYRFSKGSIEKRNKKKRAYN